MSFWVQTNHPNTVGPDVIPLMFPAHEVYDHELGFNGIVSMRYVDLHYDTAPPVEASPYLGEYRFYLYPLDPSVHDEFGMYSQLNGRKHWIFVYPQDPDYPLRYMGSDTPPTAANAKFRISAPDMWGHSTIYSPVYQKYVRAADHLLSYTMVDTPDNQCKYSFISRTSLGPVIPKPSYALSVSPKATYYIISTHFGKALSASLTPPYLTLQPIDYDSPSQKFYFKAAGAPSINQPTYPFNYNWLFAQHQNVMFCFEQSGLIGTRTAAGPWEELSIYSGSNSDDYGSFFIESFSFGNRLRAHSNNSVSLVGKYNVEVARSDLWTFVPVLAGVPYLSDGVVEDNNKPVDATDAKSAEPPTPAATEGRTNIHKLMLSVMCLTVVAILAFVYLTLTAPPRDDHPASG